MKAFTLNATDPGTPNQINISMLSPAIYILKVNDGRSTTSRKLVVID
ncbi:MAG: T9SS type A sorting domain-containing protein [Bacteroidetes bacterium]|nr:T9SS type A sorting domain-containing protein [Bacteroidota bacterium]